MRHTDRNQPFGDMPGMEDLATSQQLPGSPKTQALGPIFGPAFIYIYRSPDNGIHEAIKELWPRGSGVFGSADLPFRAWHWKHGTCWSYCQSWSGAYWPLRSLSFLHFLYNGHLILTTAGGFLQVTKTIEL